MNHIHATGTIIIAGDKFLVVKRNNDSKQGGQWSLPSGMQDVPGEAVVDTAIREIWEETHYHVDPALMQLVRVFEYPEVRPETHLTYTLFKAEISEIYTPELQKSELQDWKWVTVSECQQLPDQIRGLDDVLESVFGVSSV